MFVIIKHRKPYFSQGFDAWCPQKGQTYLNKSEAYSEPCQTSKMERFVKIVNGYNPLILLANHSILDVWQAFE